jgi:hypothetical protein
MPRFDPNQRIFDVLGDVNEGAFRIPNIQRGYEWDSQRVLKLSDLNRETFLAFRQAQLSSIDTEVHRYLRISTKQEAQS